MFKSTISRCNRDKQNQAQRRDVGSKQGTPSRMIRAGNDDSRWNRSSEDASRERRRQHGRRRTDRRWGGAMEVSMHSRAADEEQYENQMRGYGARRDIGKPQEDFDEGRTPSGAWQGEGVMGSEGGGGDRSIPSRETDY